MKRYKQPELHFDEKELKTDLGSGNTIFVGSSCDMWAKCIAFTWIDRILDHCEMYWNDYLFQSKNPSRFKKLPFSSMIGTTIETDIHYEDIMANAPVPMSRYLALMQYSYPKMVSIEPIMDFNLETIIHWIRDIKPEFVSIGADSGNNHLPEPSSDKVKALIEALKEFTEVKIKDNLKRLL